MEITITALPRSDSMVGVILGEGRIFGKRNFNKSRTTLCVTLVQNWADQEPHKCDGSLRAAVWALSFFSSGDLNPTRWTEVSSWPQLISRKKGEGCYSLQINRIFWWAQGKILIVVSAFSWLSIKLITTWNLIHSLQSLRTGFISRRAIPPHDSSSLSAVHLI